MCHALRPFQPLGHGTIPQSKNVKFSVLILDRLQPSFDQIEAQALKKVLLPDILASLLISLRVGVAPVLDFLANAGISQPKKFFKSRSLHLR